MREEVLVHEAVVGFGMFTGEADIFILSSISTCIPFKKGKDAIPC